MEFLFGNLLDLTWQHVVMWCIGGLLIYLAIAKDMEPTLLLPIGFGTLLVNIPNVDLIQEGGLGLLSDCRARERPHCALPRL